MKEKVQYEYVEVTKRKNEELKLQHTTTMQQLLHLQRQDWAKQILELQQQNELLREELTHKHKELTDIKQNLSIAMQSHIGTNNGGGGG